MNKKNVVIIESVLIIVLAGLNIYQYVNKDEEKIIKEKNFLYDCVKASDTKDGSVPGTDHVIFKYDDVGKLLDMEYISEYKYDEKAQYDSAVKFYKEYGTSKYEYDDKNYTIKIISKEIYSSQKDEQGNEIDKWVKNYIDNYKEQGYICESN